MNNQKPEPRSKGDGSTLDFHSMFFTLQGEGPFTGHRSIFVRLAGCNLQCPGCDTEYTEGRKELEISNLLFQINELSFINNAMKCLIVITGGEPLRQSIGLFVEQLLGKGYSVQIESNGVFAPDDTLDYYLQTANPKLHLVVSPKTKHINKITAALATCFKYVIDHRSVASDGLPVMALEHPASTGVARPPDWSKPIYVNPYDVQNADENQLNLNAAAASAMQNGYICGVQLHKLIGLE
jgi:7-carboxy-7-deazaguanine synthase